LNYGGGAPELWSALSSYFLCPVAINLAASQTTTQFSVGLSGNPCSVAYFDLELFDNTLNQGWFALNSVTATGNAGSALAESFQGHSYQFRARAHSTAGIVGPWSIATTAVSMTATLTHLFNGLYTLDSSGGLHTDNSQYLGGGAYWPGWSVVRTGKAWTGGPDAGAVLDNFGGLHPYGAPFTIATSAYWPGWDIARDFAFLPNASGGFVLDGFGGLHPFHVNGSTAALQAQGNAYWQSRDIARKVVILPDATGGLTLDAYGGVHPFGINGPVPASIANIAGSAYWPGWDIARDMVLVAGNGNHSGYVLDGFGGMHPFHPTTDGSAMPGALTTAYWKGNDLARSEWFLPGSATAGYTLDGYGGVHPFGGAPAITGAAYWQGRDIARSLLGE
jgi:hypothetical protein